MHFEVALEGKKDNRVVVGSYDSGYMIYASVISRRATGLDEEHNREQTDCTSRTIGRVFNSS